jgi:hypothetical protein
MGPLMNKPTLLRKGKAANCLNVGIHGPKMLAGIAFTSLIRSRRCRGAQPSESAEEPGIWGSREETEGVLKTKKGEEPSRSPHHSRSPYQAVILSSMQ